MTKMRVHKRVLVGLLQRYPEELQDYLPDYEGSAEDAIRELESDPREWLDEFDGTPPKTSEPETLAPIDYAKEWNCTPQEAAELTANVERLARELHAQLIEIRDDAADPKRLEYVRPGYGSEPFRVERENGAWTLKMLFVGEELGLGGREIEITDENGLVPSLAECAEEIAGAMLDVLREGEQD